MRQGDVGFLHVDTGGSGEVGELGSGVQRHDGSVICASIGAVDMSRARGRVAGNSPAGLAHELKNPLFPLQTTIENLQRAKNRPEQFREVFQESHGDTGFPKSENLKAIVGRFSDFAKMPQPELAPTNLNEIVRDVMKLFEAQFGAAGRPPVTRELHLEEKSSRHDPGADAALLHRIVENLVLNAMDAMPAGERMLMLPHLSCGRQRVLLEVSDTGVRIDARRVRTAFHSVLHDQAAWHWAGPGDRAGGGERSRRADFG